MKRLQHILQHNYELSAALVVLVFAIITSLLGYGKVAQTVISLFSIFIAVKLFIGMIKDLMGGTYGIDILAVVAIIATVVVGEYWAAIVIVLMLTGGVALEEYAEERAKSELTALLERAPTHAHRVEGDDIVDIRIDEVKKGDKLAILPSEVVPVDAVIIEGSTLIDESSLTGESVPAEKAKGMNIMSGSVNGEARIIVTALETAENSQYAQIVKLVKEAGEHTAPFVRLADRYAVPFTLIAFGIAGVAWWVSGDALRFAQVLVVATPCPLLLGAPIAIISGMSRATKHGVIIKSGGVLEKLAVVKTIAFDKTGTLTEDKLKVASVIPHKVSENELLAIAASVERDSTHMTAEAIVAKAKDQKCTFEPFKNIEEVAGKGVRGTNKKDVVLVGRKAFLEENGVKIADDHVIDGTATYVAQNGNYVGAITFEDTVRKNSKSVIKKLRDLGIAHIAMITGDHKTVADKIAKQTGIDDVHAQCLPADKIKAIEGLSPAPVMMVGDGVNDAPVLAKADVGVAMGARGATAASESADVVVMLDDISKVVDSISIAKHTMNIALQSVMIGIVISVGLMICASFGWIPAVVGAALQEVVDVVVIVYALRAHRG